MRAQVKKRKGEIVGGWEGREKERSWFPDAYIPDGNSFIGGIEGGASSDGEEQRTKGVFKRAAG